MKTYTTIAAVAPAERPLHPIYGRALGGQPRIVDGVIFRPYRAAILQAHWISDDFRIELHDYLPRRARIRRWGVKADGQRVEGADFKDFGVAARAGIAALQAVPEEVR